MAENKPKITWRQLWPEFLSILLAAAGIYGISFLQQKTFDITLSNMVLGMAGTAILGFHLRQAYLNEELDYDNGGHYLRFWICFWIGMAGAFICVFLPAGGWPYITIYVLLALFSNMSTGILAASVLLMLPVVLGGATTGAFFLYFLSGLFAVTLFRNLKDNFRFGIRLFLSLLCLFLCETAGIVLLENERPSLESFMIPTVNIIISGILLLGILKLFSSSVIYKYREKYLELNDTENTLLADYRSTSRSDYMHSIHTAYFCERIAARLLLSTEDLKCAGYYHRICGSREQLLEEQEFPPRVRDILLEYLDKKNPVRSREAAVLVCSDKVVGTIQYLLGKSEERNLDYDRIIDTVFRRFAEADTFGNCDLSLRELKIMQDIFKEEKLYYDFLR